MLTLSQIVYGVRDLDAAAQRIAALGLTVVEGGRHPGLGTANYIVPLGESYFEILGVVNRQEAERNPFGRALLEQIAAGDRLVCWSLRTDAIEAIASKLGLTAEKRSRRRPDGTLLTWRAAGLSLALQMGWLPFFMQWDDPANYPGILPVQHAIEPRGVAWLEVHPGDPAQLQRWLGDAQVPLRIGNGPPGVQRVGLSTERGLLILP